MENKILLKINHILFWWYYKRVPKHFHNWTFFKSIRILISNYEHALYVEKGLNEVIGKAIKIEESMTREISNLRLQIIGVDPEIVRDLNEMFGTDFKDSSHN